MDSELNRREFLKTTTVAAMAASGVMPEMARAGEARRWPGPMGRSGLVDTNVTLARWPFRRLPLDETPGLVAKLRSQGVVQAWAGSFDGLLHKDLAGANARLATECRQNGRGLLVPFGAVNPKLPDWEEEVCRCHEQHKMPGIRLHPNYHGYRLDDPNFAKLLDLAGERGLLVQLTVGMEDERTQHPLLRVPHVDVAPLPGLLKERPKARVVLLNWSRGVSGGLLSKLANGRQVFFDIATLEGVGGVANLIRQVPVEQVVFGSYAPCFYFESALLKLKEAPLSQRALELIQAGNARRALV